MRKEQEDKVDPALPALVVLYGATRKKVRPLDRELTVLGRAPGCDIGLVSPEVAPVHCVIVRLGSGWRIRDCSGRSTRVNGRTVSDEPLRNGDVLQVGTFSFEAHLPNVPAPAPRGASGEEVKQIDRLRQSRRRLGELALSLRRQLRDQASELTALARREADLDQMDRRARAALQEAIGRKAEIDEARRQLDRREAELAAYAAALRRQAQRQRDQEQQQDAQAEAEITRQRLELRQEREDLQDWRDQLRSRHEELETMVRELQSAFVAEREDLAREKALITAERVTLGELRQQLLRHSGDLRRFQTDSAPIDRTPTACSVHETQHDDPGSLDAVRQLLRELAERRKCAETKHDEPSPLPGHRAQAVE